MSLRSCLMGFVKMRKKKQFFLSQPNSFGISKDKIKRANKYGFTADEYVIYDFDKNSPLDYISEFERIQYREQIRDIRTILDNKIICYCLLRHFVAMNKMYAYKLSHDMKCTMLEDIADENSLVDLLTKVGKLVYKRISMGGGDGFKLLEHTTKGFLINRTPCKKSEIEDLLFNTDDYLIEEYCVQSDFENKFFPYSLNTVRMITVIHKDGCIEPILSLQRMGVDTRKCVDNACAGGLYAEIDVQTGVLSPARSHAKKLVDKLYEKHPITMAPIAGTVIPDWKNIVQQLVELHDKLRFTSFKFIAWDIALTNEGIKIVEANASCSMDLAQTFRSQRDDKIGLWMKEWGYIK